VRCDGEGAIVARRIVYPSGFALATTSAAIVPPAPARFSTMMVWPRYSPSFLCMTRATVSVPPLAAKPTTRVIGRLG